MEQLNSVFRHDTKQVISMNVKSPLHFIKCGQLIAAASGSQIVVYDPKTNQQVQFIFHSSPQISCIAATLDGKKLAVGESTQGSIIYIYDLSQERNIYKPDYTIKGHRLGVDLMEWSPNNKYLVSLSNKDGSLFVWQGISKMSQNKMGKIINKIFFTSKGHLITIGVKNFKIWPFQKGEIIRNLVKDTCWMMDSKSVGLGRQLQDKQFVNASQKQGRIVAITSDGVLCVIKNQVCSNAVDLMLKSLKGFAIFDEWAMCGGENSIIKIVDIETLKLVATFPKPPPINNENIYSQQMMLMSQKQTKYSQCLQIKIINNLIVTLYESGMIFVWKFQDSKITYMYYLMGHGKQLTCLQVLDQIPNQISFFATASADNTIKIWHLYAKYFNDKKSIDFAQMMDIKRNAYCKYLTRVIYCNQTINKIKSTKTLMIVSSNNKIYTYSLSSYQLLHQTIINKSTINTIQIYKNQLFVGLSSNTINIYNISQAGLKNINIIPVPIKIQNIKVLDKMMIVFGNKTILFIDINTKSIIKQQKDIYGFDLYGEKDAYYIKGKTLQIYSLLKRKQKDPIYFQKGFDSSNVIVKVMDNFILTLQVLQNNHSSLVVWSHEGSNIYHRIINEKVQNVQITKDGNCLIANSSGSVVIQQFIYRQKFMQLQRQFKQYFNQNDLSWSCGSIWTSQIRNNVNTVDDLLISISGPFNQQLNDSDTIKIPYKHNNERTSVFIPSKITQQMNNVLENISKFQKKNQDMKSPRTNYAIEDSLKTLNLFDNLDQDDDSKLSQSIVSNIKPKVNNFTNSPQEQYKQEIIQKEKQQKQTSISPPINIVDQIYSRLSEDETTSKQFIIKNQEKLRSVYLKLHEHYGSTNTKVVNKIQDLSTEYINNLRSLLDKL